MAPLASRPLAPAGVTFLLSCLLLVVILQGFQWQPLELARLGSRYTAGLANGTAGYDGQFVYYIARNPNPAQVSAHLDAPAYRYQRILLPILARLLALGNLSAIPWALVILGLLTHTAGTWAVGQLLAEWGVNPWYALVYGLWVGFLLALIVDLPEPLAYAMVALGWLARTRRKILLSAVLFGLALFSREVSVLFVAAAWVADFHNKEWRSFRSIATLALLPFALFQVWLYRVFGQLGIASGGDMATPFEWIPFMGLWRIAEASWNYLLAMLVVFAPAILLPVAWGLWSSLRRILKWNIEDFSIALLLNCLAIVFLPFSTFRETGGLLRFACGLVLAVLLFAGRLGLRRALNYSWLWLVLNVFLLKP